ncbi:MAG: hypothetical protein M1816_007976 [Peltula sp. TS41687]|nr:MAG: hypothetical protein M1816_007976 [Peltula sp. TS41687]
MLLKSTLVALLLTCTTLGVTLPSTLVRREGTTLESVDAADSADAVDANAIDAADASVQEVDASADAAAEEVAAKAGSIRGFDVSQAQAPFNPNFWKCAYKAGYRKAVIRGYRQACGTGGSVDSNFVPAYKAARSAGFTNIDAYMFPCTGTQKSGSCKSPKKQLDEFLKVIKDNKILVHRLWFDVEPTPGRPCNAWNLGKSANLAHAKQWVSELKKTGLKWGIYANAEQWTSMFPSLSSDIGSDLPLWAVQFDKKPGVSTTTRFMGGWKKAMAKQYYLDTSTPECKGSLDLDSFSE